jgi:hypothetical protein
MQARVTRTMASVGSTMEGSGTSSMRTSPAANMTVARMASTKARIQPRWESLSSGILAGSLSGRRGAIRSRVADTRGEIREFRPLTVVFQLY